MWCINTMKQETTGYTAFELVHGRTAVNPIDIARTFAGWFETVDASDYASTIQRWLKGARQVALEKVNRSYDDQAQGSTSTAEIRHLNQLNWFWSGNQLVNQARQPNFYVSTKVLLSSKNKLDLCITAYGKGTKPPRVVHVERLKPYIVGDDDHQDFGVVDVNETDDAFKIYPNLAQDIDFGLQALFETPVENCFKSSEDAQ